jgi:CheY-like chemotaxis protein
MRASPRVPKINKKRVQRVDSLNDWKAGLLVLLVDLNHRVGASSRQLILERARHVVLPASGEEEAWMMLNEFPAVDLAIIHTELQGQQFESTVRRLKAARPDLYIIAISPTYQGSIPGVSVVLDSHDPAELLACLHGFSHRTAYDHRDGNPQS